MITPGGEGFYFFSTKNLLEQNRMLHKKLFEVSLLAYYGDNKSQIKQIDYLRIAWTAYSGGLNRHIYQTKIFHFFNKL